MQLAPYLGREWRLLALSIASMLALSAATLAKPWPMTIIVDTVLGGRPVPGWIAAPTAGLGKLELLGWSVAAMVLVLLAAQALALAQTYFTQLLGQKLVVDLRCDLYRKLQHLSLKFHDNGQLGDLVFRITGDASALNNIVSHGLLPIFVHAFTLLLIASAVFAVDPRLAAVSVLAIPLLLANTIWFSGKVKGHSRSLAEADSGLYTRVSEVLGSIRAVKAFASEDLEVARFEQQARLSQQAYVRIITLSTLGGLVNELLSGLAIAAVVLVGALIVMAGELTLGELLVFIAYLTTLQSGTTGIAQCALVVYRSRASAERVVEILSETDERALSGRRTLPEVSGAIRFEGVTFAYEPEDTERSGALRDLDLDIAAGKMAAIVGPSGAGKTTLLSLLLGFYPPGSGRVLLDGVDTRELDTRWLRRNVALVLQEPIIFSTSIAENIIYGRPGASRAEVEAAAEAAGLSSFLAELPAGLDTLVGERGARLSGGQRQRIGIARAFLKDAPILVLDEPTSNLDATTERQVFAALERLAKDRTTLIVAHRLSTAKRADKIIVMGDGRVIEEGPHEALLAQDGAYTNLWRDQGLPPAGGAVPVRRRSTSRR